MPNVHPETLSALTAGIQSEVASYVFYLRASKKQQSQDIRSILEKLALEEKDHFQILERQYDSLVRSEKWISTSDVLKQEGLPEISEEMGQVHRELIAEVEAADSLHKVLGIAYRLEKEAFDLFTSAVTKTEIPQAKIIFEQLARFEKGHMAVIEKMLKEEL
ncbi:MAG: ferritin family protein [Candidatus Zixiibacteriota bacterium]